MAGLIGAWQFALNDLPAELVDRAIGEWVRSAHPFWPRPGELRESALRHGLALPPAEVAWEEVQQQISACGWIGSPRWSSAVLERTVNTLGWSAICQCEISALGTLRAQFRDTYTAYVTRLVSTPDATAALAEHAQRQAALHAPPEPIAALPEGEHAQLDVPAGPAYATLEARRRWQAANPEKPVPQATGGVTAQIAALMALPSWRDLPEDYRRQLLARYRPSGTPATPPAEIDAPVEAVPV